MNTDLVSLISNIQNDRISVSFGMKLSLPTKYESADFHVSLTTDRRIEETLDQAFTRAKSTVADQSYKLYNHIRDSETGLIGEQPKNEGNVSTPTEVQTKQDVPVKTKDTKVLRQQIKAAFANLKSLNKIDQSEFKQNLLFNKKVDDLNELQLIESIAKIKYRFPELGL